MTSLFEQLGGKETVNAAVDIFYKKILTDPTVNHFFENTNVEQQILKQKVFLTFAFGGSKNYQGKSLRQGHQHLKVTEDHFTAVAGHLLATLEELKIPEGLQIKVMTIVAGTKPDIIKS